MNRILVAVATAALMLAVTACGSDTTVATDTGAATTEPMVDTATTDTAMTDTATTDTAMSNEMVDSATTLAISGEIAADGATLAAGDTITVTLIDLTRADPVASIVGELTIEITDQALPVPFELDVDRANLDPTFPYRLRAVITDAGGTMTYTTNSANPIDPAAQSIDVGTIELVPAA